MNLEAWIPIGIFILIAMMIPVGMIMLGIVFGSKARRPDVLGNKHIAFESGVSEGYAGRQRFPIDFYLTAMLFIIFDIESVFLYPFAVAFDGLGVFALVEMVLFILTVFVAYAYVWRRGGLEWD